MPQITFIDVDGSSQEVHADSGTNVMQAAIDNGVDGIAAECGGACSCATCHVYITQDWINKLEPAGDIEEKLIEHAVDPKENSRLSCQIIISDELDGLVVEIPASQFWRETKQGCSLIALLFSKCSFQKETIDYFCSLED